MPKDQTPPLPLAQGYPLPALMLQN